MRPFMERKKKWTCSLHEIAEKNEKRNQPVRIQVYWTLNTSTKVHGKYPCQDGSFLWYLGQQWGWYLWQVEFWCFISIVISMSFWDFSISFLKKRSHHTQANYSTSIYPSVTYPHKPLGDPGLPQLRQVQRQSALMHHQNPKHHKWYVDPGWSPPGFFMLQLELRGKNQSTYTPVSTIPAVWKQLKELLLGQHVEDLMTKSIKRACKWFSASQPNAPSSSPERTRTYEEDLLPYASVQDPLRIPDFNCPECADIQLFAIRLQNTHYLMHTSMSRH